jgi:hypothetical protein
VAQLVLSFAESDARPGESSFPVARISLKGWTGDASGNTIYVSPPCVSVQELEAAVRSLHRQLDNVLAEGKQRFDRA